MPTSIRPGDLLADRYRLDDLLSESRGARFWHAYDQILARPVAVHVIEATDERAPGLLEAARRSVRVMDRRFLRVLDADQHDDLCYVVNEWGQGRSLDILLADGPLAAHHAAWIVAETAGAVAAAHDADVTHGRLVPENVLLDHNGAVRLIGLAVDAALNGLTRVPQSTDVTDLAGCLYAALTGSWAGLSSSAVPPAHREAGSVLRPRRVRGGIPRPLDELCAEMLCPPPTGAHTRAAYDLTTARGVSDYLRAYVGNATDLSDLTRSVPLRPPVLGPPVLGPPPAPDAVPTGPQPAWHDQSPSPADQTGEQTGEQTEVLAEVAAAGVDDPSPTQPDGVAVPMADQATQAGMPVFEDSGDVGWVTKRTVPPPPPQLDEPAPKPLFAPEPPPGTPARRPRPGAGTNTGTGPFSSTGSGEYWPWDTTGPGATTGSGALVLDDDEVPVLPGRRSFRLAIVLGAAALVLLTAMVVVNLLSGRTPLSLPTEPDGTGTSSAAADPGKVVSGLTADDLDPQADPPEENPDLAPLAVDGDPATAWPTATYRQNLGPGGLKTGVGLVVDLGETRDVRSVEVTFVGAPTGVTLYLSDEAPTDVGGLTPLAREEADGRLVVTPEDGASGRYLTVWLTSLPAIAGGFRGEVAEVVVRA